ncbi:MAG: nucleoside-triphosphatase, partial [Candidatus Helarchaeota archaeon]
MKLLITGKPRSGKSTLIARVIDGARRQGLKVGGIYTPELKEGKRLGFEIVDVWSGARGILSHVNIKGSPRVSKYGINLKALLEIGVKALDTALE